MNKRVTTSAFRKMKNDGQKITMLTAYDYPTAAILDSSGVDGILVGDSLGMVILGYEDTTQVTMDDMIHHVKAVSRGTKRALVVADMPFLSYHMGVEKSVYNAGRLIQEGHAQAVKLEGGKEVVNDIKAIIKAGIPVMGHLGLTPQSIHNLGGYYVQGKTEEQANKLIKDAKSLEEAGVFSIVLELIPTELSKIISSSVSIPTIGIGAGIECDGQILVIHDMLGLYQGTTAKFVKRYGELGLGMQQSVNQYVNEVRNRVFPREEHSFHLEADTIKGVYGGD